VAAAKKYFVAMIDDDPVPVYGPYAIKSAKDFARIGSKYGGRRMVFCGDDGSIKRVYAKGYRMWPWGTNEIEEAGLSAAETPKVAMPYLPRKALKELVELRGEK